MSLRFKARGYFEIFVGEFRDADPRLYINKEAFLLC